jgi:hypothetical protein
MSAAAALIGRVTPRSYLDSAAMLATAEAFSMLAGCVIRCPGGA